MGRSRCPPCFQCRCRKVRCDRQPGTCENCARLEFKCSFSDVAPRTDFSSVQRRPERRRGTQACIECRHQKSRCSGEVPKCATCILHQRQCRYPKEVQVSREKRKVTRVENESILSLISREDLLQRIDDYFEHLYPIPSYAFLHEPTICQQSLNGTLEPSLALSIAAVSKLLVSSKEESALTTKAESIIWEHMENPSIIQLQSLVLVIHHYIQTGRFSRAYMLAGLAARAATALRLNYERPELSIVAQETRRRVLWALTFIDGHFSVGLPEYETLPHTIIYQQLPSSEYLFTGTSQQAEGQHSLLGACVRLSKVQKDIMRLTRQLALSEQPLAQLNGLVQEIQKDLWRLKADVERPCGYHINRPMDMNQSRWFPRFLQISISWHQAHCDLYRLFLPGYPEAAPLVILNAIEIDVKEHAVRQCDKHVTRINQLLSDLLASPHSVLPHYVAICAYQATRLTLFLSCSPDVRIELGMADAIQKAHTAVVVTQTYFSSPSTKELVLDLQRLVQVADNDPPSINKELCPSPPLDEGVHRHNHLAIHSLVRQANFVDDSYEQFN